MIVSALLTSVGINTALCVLFFTLYSILRKQPSNYEVYVPRLLAEGTSKRRSRFNLERLIPSPDWVAKAWRLSEEELFSLSGLDGVVFMRTITFSLKIFTFAGIIGILVLLPVNCWGNHLQDFDVVDFTNNSLDLFTISNVNSGSNWLWVHFISVYIVTGFICLLLYYEYKYIASKRISYFDSSKPQPHQFTILVHSIPTSSSCSISDSVESFFQELYPATYLSHVIIRRTNKIRSLLIEAKNLYKRITQLRSDPTEQKYKHGGCFGLFGRKDNLIDHYGKQLEDIQENVRLQQSEASLAGEEARAAFVFFKSRYGAATAFHMQQSVNPTQWITELAPEPRDVYWPFFSESFMRRWISKLVVIFLTTLFTILFLIPVVIVQGLTNLSQLEILFPFLTSILTILMTRPFTRPDDEFEVPSIPYHRDLPRVLFVGLLGITYFFLAPLILPFLLVYLCLAYIIFRNQFINVYAPKYETAGKFWPIVHNTMIFSLVLMHIIAVGIFALKKLSPASTLMLPLPVLTLLFNEYCRKRFLPIFVAYSAESLIKKDREDQNDATMAEFYDKLIIAYKDPALFPIQYLSKTNTDSLLSPFVS
ncbi:CSC1-like protein At1g69450 isoform X3 [Gastrolobium bilobum]|uniref:CSC1-like protein At1g69450 isoform X3 n=1 Tax=Gastrolobium bilobum TaxID=150636 RepID=UPI002AAFF592|nr:CSC1-like protein At1g69450 isoform X3 [Gastrolobium bilobum]